VYLLTEYLLTEYLLTESLLCTTSHVSLSTYLLHLTSDENWNLMDEEMKKKMSFTSKADGEFWMSFRDFCKQFQEITICTLGPDFDGDGKGDQPGRFHMPCFQHCNHSRN